jgi:hypothetical protein
LVVSAILRVLIPQLMQVEHATQVHETGHQRKAHASPLTFRFANMAWYRSSLSFVIYRISFIFACVPGTARSCHSIPESSLPSRYSTRPPVQRQQHCIPSCRQERQSQASCETCCESSSSPQYGEFTSYPCKRNCRTVLKGQQE